MVMVNDLGKAIHLLVWTTTTMEINLKPGLFDRKIRFVLTFTFMLLFDRWWQTATFTRYVAKAFAARLCDLPSASWQPCWNGVWEWPCCAWSDDSTGHDSVCYGSRCTWGNIWRLLLGFHRATSFFFGEWVISLKQQACWLWYPIWYQHFPTFTPGPTRLTLEHPHLGTRPSAGGFCLS